MNSGGPDAQRSEHRSRSGPLAEFIVLAEPGAESLGSARTLCESRQFPSAEWSGSAPSPFTDHGSGMERSESWRVSHRALAEQGRHLARSEPVGDQGHEVPGERAQASAL
jgi:hypothetical protein